MAYTCDDNYEEASLSSEALVRLHFLTTEVAAVFGVESEASHLLTVEEGELGSTVSWFPSSYVYEIAALDDSTLSGTDVYQDVNELAEIKGVVLTQFDSSVTDSADLSDQIVCAIGTSFAEVASLSNLLVAENNLVSTTIETALLTGSFVPSSSSAIFEQGVATDTVSHTARFASLTTETAYLDELLAGQLNPLNLLLETATATSSLVANTATGYTEVTDTFYGSGSLIPLAKHTAWVTSTKQWAMSRYDELSSTELVGALGVSREGVFVLDKNSPVQASILTGKSDFGSDKLKRVESMYVCGEALFPLTLTVFADQDGEEVEYEYLYQPRANENTRTNRGFIGRGLISRFWQFKISNPDGGTFALRSGELNALIASRKV